MKNLHVLSDNGVSAEVVDRVKVTGEVGMLTRWTSLGPDWANVSNVPLRYFKNYDHEGGIKTPLIAYWPDGIKEGNQISNISLHLIDLMPTLAEVWGAKYPTAYNNQIIKPLDGMSFFPILKGEQVKRVKPLFWQWRNGKAVRDGDWKLVALKDKRELYNLKTDPIEEKDLSEDHSDKYEELKLIYEQWAEDMGI